MGDDRKKSTKKSLVSSSESKDKKSSLIKTQIDLEKEFEIPSYDEYKIKDNDSINEYDDEDIETKMIRLVFLKKKGENIKDKINIKKKVISKKSDNLSKMQKIKIAIGILEKWKLKRKKKLLFKYLKQKKFSLGLKIALNFYNKIKKYIMKIYIKEIYDFIFPNNKIEKAKESLISRNKNKNLVMFSPQISNKKIKKFKFPKKVSKLELFTKKTSAKEKKGGVENIFERVKKEKEKEKILGEKLKKLENIKKREREYILRIAQKKKKIKHEIEIYKKNNNISDDAVSQIKQINNISSTGSNFFSNNNSSKLGTFHLDTTIVTGKFSNISRKKNRQKTTKELKLSQIIKGSKQDKKEDLSDIYSFNKKKLNISEAP